MAKVADAVAAVEGAGTSNRLLFELGTKHAVMAIKADREACTEPSLDLFESAAAQYETTIAYLNKALATEKNPDTRAVVQTKLGEYQARRTVMLNWIRDYRASRDSTTRPPTSAAPSTPAALSTTAAAGGGESDLPLKAGPALSASAETSAARVGTVGRSAALPKAILGRTALDVAFGILLAAAMGMLFHTLVRIFEPYLLPALMAAIVATALRPLSTRIALALGGRLPPMSDTERERFEAAQAKRAARTIRTRVIGSAKRLVPFTLVLGMALVRSPGSALLFLGLTLVSALIAAATVALGRVAVASGSISAHSAAAAITVGSVLSSLLIFGSIFAAGISMDIAQGVQDSAVFARRLAQESGGAEVIAEQIDVLQEKIAAGIADNHAAVMEYNPTVQQWTGVDLTEAVGLIANAASGSDTGGSELPVSAVRAAVAKQLPGSVEELQGRGQNAYEQFQALDIDLEPIKEAAILAAKSAAQGAGEFAAKLGEMVERIGATVTFVVLLPVLLGRRKSAVSLVTDILPMPHKRHNDQIEIDLRTAIGALVVSLVRGFVIEACFVYLLFGAFQLNMEFLASLLAGLGSTLPFLPPGIFWTAVLGLPQLAAGKRFVEMAALLILHFFLDTGIGEYLERAQDGMKVGSGILDRQLFTLSVGLALPLFGRKALVVGPLLVIMGMVVYEVYKFVNEEKQAVEDGE